MSLLRVYPLAAGLILLAIGLAGSLWPVLPVSPWHDLLHLALGLGGLVAFREGSVNAARAYTVIVGGLYGTLGLLGLVSPGAAAAMGYSQVLHNLPHLLLAAAAVAALVRPGRMTRSARS